MGKADPLFLVNLHLVYKRHFNLHRILNGKHFCGKRFKLIQDGIKCRGFAASCGPGDDDNAVRLTNYAAYIVKVQARQNPD